MGVCERLLSREMPLAVVGLGYVGMPIAVAFAEKGLRVIGFNRNQARIDMYKAGIDPTNEVGDEVISKTTVDFTSDEKRLKEAAFYIVAVPTPINQDNTPDLEPLENASSIIGRNLSRDSIVVYESTVYPGVTETICIPILERESGLKCGVDFQVGYSPERINPGDKIHKLDNIRKIVSGIDKDCCNEVKKVYDIVVSAGTFPVSSIKTAEAIKVVENSQRDINIAFMNELAMVFDKMGIDTSEVIDGMNTKWNALGFRPGLVGGHCIGVDPYYFTYEAEKLGYHSQIILNGRMVNNGMGKFVAEAAIKQMIKAGKRIKKSKVVILGLTFKENCPDIRNTKVIDIIKELNAYDVDTIVVDPWANGNDVLNEYGIIMSSFDEITDADCVIVAVAHDEFKRLSIDELDSLFADSMPSEKVLLDVKSIYNTEEIVKKGFTYWRL